MTRLEQLCKLFDWRGGTIHQAEKELREVLALINSLPERIKNIDVLNCNDGDFWLAIDLYSRNYMDKEQ